MNDCVHAATVNHNIGSIYNLTGHYEHAIDYHRRALTFYEEADDTYGMAMVNDNLAYALASLRYDAILSESIGLYFRNTLASVWSE
jgi:hypothetical protein